MAYQCSRCQNHRSRLNREMPAINSPHPQFRNMDGYNQVPMQQGGMQPFMGQMPHQQNGAGLMMDQVMNGQYQPYNGVFNQPVSQGGYGDIPAGWQNMNHHTTQMPYQGESMPHQQMMPGHNPMTPHPYQEMMVPQQMSPATHQGMMPQTGYIPEEHDDDFD